MKYFHPSVITVIIIWGIHIYQHNAYPLNEVTKFKDGILNVEKIYQQSFKESYSQRLDRMLYLN